MACFVKQTNKISLPPQKKPAQHIFMRRNHRTHGMRLGGQEVQESWDERKAVTCVKSMVCWAKNTKTQKQERESKLLKGQGS